jgi:hypothetical protein
MSCKMNYEVVATEDFEQRNRVVETQKRIVDFKRLKLKVAALKL